MAVTSSPRGPEPFRTVPEPLLEPTSFPPARTFQKALFDAGIPVTLFEVEDISAMHEKLKGRDVVFRTPPMKTGTVTIAVLEDTCGNLIQLAQKLGRTGRKRARPGLGECFVVERKEKR